MPSRLLKSPQSIMQSDQAPRDRIQAFNYGNGTQHINMGDGPQNINFGGGHQYNAEIQYFVPGPPESVPQPYQGTLLSLAFLEMNSRPNKIDAATAGTCEWLTQHITYRDWARRHEGLLWIKGKPGSGKSTLLKHVLRKVEAEPGMRDKAIILSFFLHGRGGELQKTPLGLFRSLLHQLLCQVMRDLEDLLDLKELLDQVIPDRNILLDKNNLIHLDRVLHKLKRLLDRDGLLDRGKLLDLDRRLDRAKLHDFKDRLDRVLHDLKKLLNREKSLDEDKLLQGRVLHNLKKLLHLNKLLSLDGIRERNPLQGLVAMFEHQRETMGDPGKKWQWHAPELLGFFESSLPKVLEKWHIWLFVDALDECGKENAIYLIKSFQALIKNLPPTIFQFKICFSCRHYPILQLDYGSAICMEHENMRDIATFVHTQLSTSQIGSAFTIANTITHRASGVFLWARLVVERVLTLELGGEGLKNMEAEIQCIPPDLDALYDELIRSMEKRATSRRLMEWICFSAKPLSIDQLRWAMVVNPDCPHKSLQQCQQSAEYTQDNKTMERRIKTLSCGLAEIVQWGTVQFIHQSVKDFFLEKGLLILANSDGNLVSRDLAVGLAHYNLSRTCIHYLAMEEFARFSRFVNLAFLESQLICETFDSGATSTWLGMKFPLLHYATTSWVFHARQAEAKGICQDGLLQDFGWPSEGLMQLWVRVYREMERHSNDRPSEGTSLLHVVSRYGLTQLLSVILQKAGQLAVDIDCRDNYGWTSLSWAALGGHEAVVKLLLNTGKVDINARDEKFGRTPLWWAGDEGHKAVVTLLLNTDNVDVNARDTDGRTLLWRAGEKGDRTIAKLLLDSGKADSNARDKEFGWTLLSWAAKRGDVAVVELLVGYDNVDVDVRDNLRHRTPLSWAAQGGHKAVVKMLLDTGKVDVNARDREFGRTPLSWAAQGGHKAVVKLLLDTGNADVNARDSQLGYTPLWWARLGGDAAAVDLLLHYPR